MAAVSDDRTHCRYGRSDCDWALVRLRDVYGIGGGHETYHDGMFRSSTVLGQGAVVRRSLCHASPVTRRPTRGEVRSSTSHFPFWFCLLLAALPSHQQGIWSIKHRFNRVMGHKHRVVAFLLSITIQASISTMIRSQPITSRLAAAVLLFLPLAS